MSGLTITGTAIGNYTLTQPTTTANITAATVTASIIGNPTKPVDGTVAATLASGNYSLTGVASGESIVVTHPAGTYNSRFALFATTVTSTALVAGDFAISGSGACCPTTCCRRRRAGRAISRIIDAVSIS